MNKRRLLAKQSGVRSTIFGYSKSFNVVTINESSLEHDYKNWMIFSLPSDANFIMQPDKFRYQVKGKYHYYTADGKITLRNGAIYMDEVKYLKDTLKPAVAIKHQNLKNAFAREENTIFRVFTEEDIRVGQRAENLKYLQPCFNHPAPIEQIEALLKGVKSIEFTLSELYELADKKNIERITINHAIAHKLLKTDLTKHWNDLVCTLPVLEGLC